MATLFVDKLDPQSGTAWEIGSSGDTITTATGAKPSFLYPAFEAYLNANQSVSDATATKVAFNVEHFDTNSAYDNSSNYRFTPQTSGKYFVYAQVAIAGSGVNANGYSDTAIYFNGSANQKSTIDVRDTSSNGGNKFTVTTSQIIVFNGSSDYVEIYARCFDNTGATPSLKADNNSDNVFGAYKIIE